MYLFCQIDILQKSTNRISIIIYDKSDYIREIVHCTELYLFFILLCFILFFNKWTNCNNNVSVERFNCQQFHPLNKKKLKKINMQLNVRHQINIHVFKNVTITLIWLPPVSVTCLNLDIDN